MKKKYDFASVIFYGAVIITILTLCIYALFFTRTKEQKVADYLNENSEDGISIVAVQKAESNRKGYKYYFAWTIDSDGDYEMLVIKVHDGKYESYEVEWK